MRTFAALSLLTVACYVAACCAASCVDYPIHLEGQVISSVAGTGSGNAQVEAELRALLQDRMYYPGTYMCWGGCTGQHDASKLVPGPVDSFHLNEHGLPDHAGSVEGVGVRQSGRYIMSFTLPQGVLTLDSDHNRTQGIIYELRPEQGPHVSGGSVVADCTFSGTLAGQPVDLTFQQLVRATEEVGFFYGS
jgi:hypothetical protein